MSHSKASWFSDVLLLDLPWDPAVFVLIHSRISALVVDLYESLSSHLTRRTLRYGVLRKPGIWCRRSLPAPPAGGRSVLPVASACCSVEPILPPIEAVWNPSSRLGGPAMSAESGVFGAGDASGVKMAE